MPDTHYTTFDFVSTQSTEIRVIAKDLKPPQDKYAHHRDAKGHIESQLEHKHCQEEDCLAFRTWADLRSEQRR
eukprot:1285958-Amphidinium_carterae.2